MSQVTKIGNRDLFMVDNDHKFSIALDLPTHVDILVDSSYKNAFAAEAVLHADGHHTIVM